MSHLAMSLISDHSNSKWEEIEHEEKTQRLHNKCCPQCGYNFNKIYHSTKIILNSTYITNIGVCNNCSVDILFYKNLANSYFYSVHSQLVADFRIYRK